MPKFTGFWDDEGDTIKGAKSVIRIQQPLKGHKMLNEDYKINIGEPKSGNLSLYTVKSTPSGYEIRGWSLHRTGETCGSRDTEVSTFSCSDHPPSNFLTSSTLLFSITLTQFGPVETDHCKALPLLFV